MNLYEILVNSICGKYVFKDLVLLNYEINKYKITLINLNDLVSSDILNNLNQKMRHPILKCSYRYIFIFNGIEYIVYFETYHTFTSKPINSVFLFRNQYLNINDFIITQNHSFCLNNNSYDITNLEKIRYNFNKSLIKYYIENPLHKDLINCKQGKNKQIIYINSFNININPLNWLRHTICIKK